MKPILIALCMLIGLYTPTFAQSCGPVGDQKLTHELERRMQFVQSYQQDLHTKSAQASPMNTATFKYEDPSLEGRNPLLLKETVVSATALRNTTGTTYYWVGGTGNWSDTTHWATSSGGSDFHSAPPTISDNVYFDANSFTAEGQVVTLDEFNSYAHSIDWTGVQFNPHFEARELEEGEGGFITLWISGDFSLSPDMTADLSDLHFTGTGNLDIYTAGTYVGPKAWFALNYPEGDATYNLTSDLNTGYVFLKTGGLNTNGYQIQTDEHGYFWLWGNEPKNLDISNSSIYARLLQMDTPDSIMLNAASSHIQVSRWFRGGGLTYHDVTIGNDSLRYLQTLNGANTFNTLTLLAGTDLHLEPGTTQTVNQLVAVGTQEDPIGINSWYKDPVVSYISQASGTVNAEYVSLRHNHAIGGATFNATNSWADEGTSGWNVSLPADPVDVTFHVNMNFAIARGQFDPQTQTVDIAGGMNGWGNDLTQMTDVDGDGIYSTTASLFVGNVEEFKFRIDGTWDGEDHDFPAGSNRVLTIPAGNTSHTFWFKDQNPNNPRVEFQVEMNHVEGYETGMPVAVRFGNEAHSLGSYEMHEVDTSGVYSFESYMRGMNDTYEYTFLFGDNIGETIGKRYYTIATSDTVLYHQFNDGDSIELPSSAYYWVGGTGNWSDVGHWATSSGGSEFHETPPTNEDDVYFDSNSFTAEGQVVTLDEFHSYAHNIDWTGVQFNPHFEARELEEGEDGFITLWISGDFSLSPDMTADLSDLHFTGTGDREIYTGGTYVGPKAWFALNFPEGDATYTLTSEMNTGYMFLAAGALNTNGYDVHTDEHGYFWMYGSQPRTVQLGQSTITGSRLIMDAPDSLSLDAGTSDIHMTKYFRGGGLAYHNVTIGGDTTGYMPWIESSNSYNTLTILAGTDLHLQPETTQTVNQLVAVGTQEEPIGISSWQKEPVVSYISQDTGTVNAEYVSLRHNHAIGGATFSATNSWADEGTSGWNVSLPADPVDVTFHVNMNYAITQGQFDPQTQTVDIAGGMNGWGNDLTQMTDIDGDGIYSHTASLTVGNVEEFKFRIDGSWDAHKHEFPGGHNRALTIPAGNTSHTFWFNDQNPNNPRVEFQVEMNNVSAFETGMPVAVRFVNETQNLGIYEMHETETPGIYAFESYMRGVNNAYEYTFQYGDNETVEDIGTRFYTNEVADTVLHHWFNDVEWVPEMALNLVHAVPSSTAEVDLFFYTIGDFTNITVEVADTPDGEFSVMADSIDVEAAYYTDATASTALRYYRLKGISAFDGSEMYSEVVAGAAFSGTQDSDWESFTSLAVSNGTHTQYVRSIDLDEAGNQYIGGYFYGSIQLGNTTLNAENEYMNGFVAKLNADGTQVLYSHVFSATNYQDLFGTAVYDVVKDGDNNLYVTGYYNGDFFIDGSAQQSNGGGIYLLKVDASGNIAWSKYIRSEGCCNSGYGLDVDGDNNVYLTGYFAGTNTIDAQSVQATGYRDMLLAKFNSDGSLGWMTSAGGADSTAYTRAFSIEVTTDAIYVGGDFSESTSFDNVTLTAVSAANGFVAKYSLEGAAQWVKAITDVSAQAYAPVYGLTSDEEGNPYIGGFYDGESLTAGGVQITASQDGRHPFLAKLNASDGTAQWATLVAQGPKTGILAVDYDNGKVYATGFVNSGGGTFENASIADEGAFVAAYEADGNFSSVALIEGGATTGRSMRVSNGTAAVSGYYSYDVAYNNQLIEAEYFNQTGFTATFAVETASTCTVEKPVITVGENNLLTSSSAAGYQWFKDGTAIEGANDSTYEVTQSGDYTVQVTVDECVSEISDAVAIEVEADVLSAENLTSGSFKLYPVPAGSQLNVVYQPKADQLKVVIYNLIGEEMMSWNKAVQSEAYQLDISKLRPALYMLVIQDGQHTQHYKFVKK